MENEQKITLYQARTENGDSFHLWAWMFNGTFHISGQDFSEAAKRMFGDEEYEYFYDFDLENTNKIISILKCDDLLKTIKERFNWETESEFREFCEKNGIKYSFTSY